MIVSTVEKVREIRKNGRVMYLVTIEGENYMCFDGKWKDTEGSVVKFDKVKKGEFTNLNLVEIIGKKEEEDFPSESVETGKSNPRQSHNTVLNVVNGVAIAFIRAGVILTPDDWLTFLKQAVPAYNDFLAELKGTEES